VDERGGEHDLLSHPLGHVLAQRVLFLREVEEVEPLGDPLVRVGDATQPADELEVLDGREEGGRRLALGDDPKQPKSAPLGTRKLMPLSAWAFVKDFESASTSIIGSGTRKPLPPPVTVTRSAIRE
jgi:hypothetical protein